MRNLKLVVAMTLALTVGLFLPALVSAEHHEGDSTADEVRAAIMAESEYTRENLMDMEGGVVDGGALEFWSSGGLMQWVPADAPPNEYEAFTIRPKHLKVRTLVEGQAAVAMYYSEGRMQVKGGAAVDHYMTRVTQVWVKEDGKWKVSAAHWSPIAGGSGTRQNSLD